MQRYNLIILLLVLISFVFNTNSVKAKSSKTKADQEQLQALQNHEQLKKQQLLFNDYNQYWDQQEYKADHKKPEMRKGRFADISVEAYQKKLNDFKLFLERAKSINLAVLSREQQINNQILQAQLMSLIESIEFEDYLFPMQGDTGFYFSLLRLGETTQLNNKDEATFYLEKLADMPRYLSQWSNNMDRAISLNKLLPAIILVDLEKPLTTLVVKNIEQHPLYKPAKHLEKIMSATEAKEYQAKLAKVIKNKVQPAITQMIDYLANVYIPKGRKSIAITEIPQGADYYQSQIRLYTTLNLTADQIHNIGLNEVKRIKAEMMQVIDKSGFKGSFAEFLHFLRTDPQFYAKSPLELLKEAAYISKKMDGKLPQFFTRLPRQPYGVEPVPAAIAPRYTTGRYSGAPLDSKRAGEYWVNTYALEKRPLYVLEALTLHEAVPGHHLQAALSKELSDLPEFRRNSYISAYGEGWALYCEKLGIEAGFYQDAYSQFGRLSYEMWRAIRLVVDTGMHTKGWSRERAIDFMQENTALSKHNIITEIDRYIAWPAQALSYKMGELKIVELRTKAEKVLGLKFDIRLFHDEILAHGSVPLNVLEDNVNAWIESMASQTPE
jgi:uncharacterized protein (DUF885 family)